MQYQERDKPLSFRQEIVGGYKIHLMADDVRECSV